MLLHIAKKVRKTKEKNTLAFNYYLSLLYIITTRAVSAAEE